MHKPGLHFATLAKKVLDESKTVFWSKFLSVYKKDQITGLFFSNEVMWISNVKFSYKIEQKIWVFLFICRVWLYL